MSVRLSSILMSSPESFEPCSIPPIQVLELGQGMGGATARGRLAVSRRAFRRSIYTVPRVTHIYRYQ